MTMDVGAGTVELNTFRRNTWEHLPPKERVKAPRNHDYYSFRVAPLGIHNFKEPYALATPRSSQDVLTELKQDVELLYHRARLKQPNQGRVRGNRTWDRAR